MVATTLSIAALTGFLAAAVVTFRLRRDASSASRRQLAAGGTALALVLALLPVDSLVGDVQSALFPAQPRLEFLPGEDHRRTFVLFPTITLTARQAYGQQLPMLQQYGHVLLVDYPLGNFNAVELNNRILQFMQEHNLTNPHLIGTSFGVFAGIEFIRHYRAQQQPRGPIGHFMPISGPVDGSDVKTEIPLALALVINGGPLSQWVWSRISDDVAGLQHRVRPIDPALMQVEPGVTREQVVKEYRQMKDANVRALLARLQALYRGQGLAAGEFPDIAATVLWVAYSGGDYLVRFSAVGKLQEGFPNHEVHSILPGFHANLIRFGPSYTEVMAEALAAHLTRDAVPDWVRAGQPRPQGRPLA
ncbi:MAG: hypothetical protein GEU81_07145 [Nitriliruptorales bacterium]|nr:hypothetical protein [Nitriliruptorales bacterium]